MYSVTKRIEFCYGHRLLDYDGICKHPHGHNATAEIEVRTGTLDNRNMVCDFSDIKRIEFCYGHRLLDYDGICKHPHGHNASVEVEVRTDRLDNRNMVADFSDIKRVIKGWIDRELDHKMILRRDDPLVEPLKTLGEPMYLLESNPTVERLAKLIYDKGRELGVDIITVRIWETPTSFASYSA